MNKLEEVKRAQVLIKLNKIHPNEVESVYSLISDEKSLSQAEKAQTILDYEVK